MVVRESPRMLRPPGNPHPLLLLPVLLLLVLLPGVAFVAVPPPVAAAPRQPDGSVGLIRLPVGYGPLGDRQASLPAERLAAPNGVCPGASKNPGEKGGDMGFDMPDGPLGDRLTVPSPALEGSRSSSASASKAALPNVLLNSSTSDPWLVSPGLTLDGRLMGAGRAIG